MLNLDCSTSAMMDRVRIPMKRASCYVSAIVLGCASVRAQVQSGKLMASDGYPGQTFGRAIAADGDWTLVGVLLDSQIGPASGAAYMFRLRGSEWFETQKLLASDAQAGDNFGCNVAIDGSMLVVGSQSDDPQGVFAAGSAYVFELRGGEWRESAKLNSAPPASNAFFGYSVAIDGDRILVGARNEHAVALNSGAAYVFERNGLDWVQTARLIANDGANWDFFGQSVALHGDTALIGSSADGPGGNDQGAAYVFEFNGVAWTQVAKLRAADGAASNAFSNSLALGDGVALVGAATHSHGLTACGSAYVFERQGSVWTQTQELRAHAPGLSLGFGTSVALANDLMLIGASKDPLQAQSRGAAYVFRRTSLGWLEIGRMQANDAADSDFFGGRVALSDATAVIGVALRDDLCPQDPACNSGAVYVFDLAADARQFGWCANGAPCGNAATNAGCANSMAVGATLAAAGSSSVVQNELRFEVRQMQPGRSALLFMGRGTGQTALGDGLRMVAPAGGGLYRFGAQLSGADGAFEQRGVVAHSQAFATPGQLQPGATWNFQCWYRDPAGPCGAGTNLTNAVEVLFRP
jgi:hypothetical protein